ncbi:hypothetical protein CB0940_06665 [Cercospora beticola]|uniref:Uncharacterized protein n=1 Tax=Cercospora beticola TaxID=122368 RepID=A0A2G5I1I7_CERBT|nr:hypothetical protein CB0940_06665 [Cercospora beticola]PIA98383.1 hypothetical protein CB0940_06665 [Cercospora beticola]WPA99329.1 hypothetical protein RHO25_003946 [Cercospora beticola]CAK1360653.1 unnamed protein product [Cercospora beticola]
MHLDHKLPWNLLASQLSIIRTHARYTPHVTDIFSKEHDDWPKHLEYFQKAFHNTLLEFSQTEASRFSDLRAWRPSSTDEVLSDTLRSLPERIFNLGQHETNSLRHNPIGPQHQSLQYWISRASESQPPSYTSSDGDLADVVKTLLTISAHLSTSEDSAEQKLGHEAFASLLKLNKDSGIPLEKLNHIHWGHSFGIEHIAEDTLKIYLLLNAIDAIRQQQQQSNSGRTTQIISIVELESFRKWARNSLVDFDFPAQNLLHCDFWRSHVDAEEQMRSSNATVLDDRVMQGLDPTLPGSEGWSRDDGIALKRYLRTCFGILVRYNILLLLWYGEDHAKSFWDEQVGYCLEFRQK